MLAATFGFIAVKVSQQWDEVRTSATTLRVHWGYIALASTIILGTYLMLIQSWRMLLTGWGGSLAYPTAVRIWFIANLGKYLPGKVWSIGALGVLASREGVSGVAAAGAAILGTALNIGAGFAVAVIAGAEGVDRVYPGLRAFALVGTLAFILGVALLPALLPSILDRYAAWRGVSVAEQHLSRKTVWIAALINAASWICYGLAFALFARGVLPQLTITPTVFIASYAASYLVGFFALFSPGGLGFRELALTAILVGLGAAGRGDAVMLGATSRVWLTVLEVLPGLIGLIFLPRAQRAALGQST
ncbi:lysylphosphatidylglycerol synthase domain-containing protein [Gemmatimonas sp.]|uniref:lysylphosphatidylglycerol synthase domain-containing protein n=1 Tax=Gemmatimonas sp. TaxID=1962908 RepID=UPI003F6F8A2C